MSSGEIEEVIERTRQISGDLFESMASPEKVEVVYEGFLQLRPKREATRMIV